MSQDSLVVGHIVVQCNLSELVEYLGVNKEGKNELIKWKQTINNC